MEHTKVSHPQGQLSPRPRSVVKHETAEERERARGRKGGRQRREKREERTEGGGRREEGNRGAHECYKGGVNSSLQTTYYILGTTNE